MMENMKPSHPFSPGISSPRPTEKFPKTLPKQPNNKIIFKTKNEQIHKNEPIDVMVQMLFPRNTNSNLIVISVLSLTG